MQHGPTRRRRWSTSLTGVGALLAASIPISLLTPSVASAATPTDLFISEYVEGSSNNKALEFFNGTGTAIDLAAGAYSVQMFFNGNPVSTLTINLTGTVAAGDVFVLAQASANATILAAADQTNGSGWFNGDDAIVLRKGTTVLDVVGQVGLDPGTEWGTGLTSTADNTLRRKAGIAAGDTDGSDAFDPAAQWDGSAVDTFDGLGAHVFASSEEAPTVVSVAPVNGATEVPGTTNVSVTFSEPVTAAADAFGLTCATTGAVTVATSGGPTVFTLDPSVTLVSGELCTLAVTGSKVTDEDTIDPPDAMVADFTSTFTVFVNPCGQPFTSIASIQGSGAASPLVGTSNVSTEGVVTGDRQGSTGLNGFFLQSVTPDADPATSEGVFVFAPGSADVNVGDVVRVRGRVVEFNGLTEIDQVASLVVCSTGGAVTATTVDLPETVNGELERYEGMLVNIPQTLTVQQNFFLGRYGQMTLGVGGRLPTTTDVFVPGSPAALTQADLNARSMIVLDDGRSSQNPNPIPYIGADNTVRAGDSIAGLTGNLDFGPINSDSSIRDYRIHPTVAPAITRVNARTAAPDPVGGSLKVASFNVLNYFNGDGVGGGFPTPRGATTPAELDRQRAKIVSAITAIDADVVGLMEIENDPSGTSAIADLVAALNAAAGAGTYSFIDTGVIGGDEIKVGLIYQPAAVTPIGAFTTLTSAVNPLFVDTLNRPALAQAFRSTANGATFNVVVNHLKSKGSACAGDPDVGDGQGNCNQTRLRAATALAQWIATDPTKSGDADYLVIGDLNSYAKEDPIRALESAGFTNLVEQLLGASGYSYVFDGMSGSLDHALASPTLTPQVTGVTEWHINADEPSVIDYQTEFKPQDLFSATPYRSSDHDPVIVGLALKSFEFDGFERPVRGSTLSRVKAGSTVPVKFELEGAGRRPIFSAIVQQVDCATGLAIGSPTPAISKVDDDDDDDDDRDGDDRDDDDDDDDEKVVFDWRTEKAWARTCRVLTFTFTDGMIRSITASFV